MANDSAPDSDAAQEKTKVSRREFLNLAWLASLGFLMVDLGGAIYFFSFPRFKEGEFGGAFTVGTRENLPAVGDPPVNNPKGKFWLSRTDEGVVALYKVCTHLGCLYNWQDQEGKFICPCHGSQFEYNGDYILGPAPRSLDQFVVQVVDRNTGEMISETDPESGTPLSIPDGSDVEIKVDTGRRLRGKPRT